MVLIERSRNVTPALEAAWEAVHDALPARWQVARPSYDPARHAWSVSAIAPHPGRGKKPTTVTGTGDDATSALRDLDDRLRGVPHPNGSRMDELWARCRLAYVAGAFERWPTMTAGELIRVIDRAPAPLGIRPAGRG